MKNKKIFGKLLIAFFIIMLVLTYASSQIYTAGLPKVTLGTPTSGDITSTYITPVSYTHLACGRFRSSIPIFMAMFCGEKQISIIPACLKKQSASSASA